MLANPGLLGLADTPITQGSIMKPSVGLEESIETSRLLSELDRMIDQSSVLREIFNAYQRLHGIESITGPSYQTRLLREEIEALENKLHCARNRPA